MNIAAAVLPFGEVGLARGDPPRELVVDPEGPAAPVGVGGELEGGLTVLGMEGGDETGPPALVVVGGELEGELTGLGMEGEGDDAGDFNRLGVEADGVGETAGVITGAADNGVGVAFVGAGDETEGAFAGLFRVTGDDAGEETGAKADKKGAPTGAPRDAH